MVGKGFKDIMKLGKSERRITNAIHTYCSIEFLRNHMHPAHLFLGLEENKSTQVDALREVVLELESPGRVTEPS
jgi:hypothetical protein